MPTKPLRGASWAAVSSLPQAKKVSLQDQLDANRQHAERHGVEIVAELVVPGESRNIVLFEDASRKMPAYAQLHDLLKRRAIDVLFFLDRSRLGRQASLSMAVVALCVTHGVAVYEIDNPPPTLAAARQQTHDDMLLGAIKSVGAEREIRKLLERQRSGMIGRVKAGKPPGALVYGYKRAYDDRGNYTIVIDEAAAAVLRQVFALYLDGHGTPYIAATLNRQGTPAPEGGQWQAINVRNLLDNLLRYAGVSAINRRSRRDRPYVEAPGAWPAIIDRETLAAIEAERQYRVANRRRSDTIYLLSGVVFCVHCRRRLVVQNLGKRQPHHLGSIQMVCREHGGLAYRRVQAALRDKIASLAGADLDALAADAPDPFSALHEQIEALAAQLAELDAAVTRADNAYVRGLLPIERYEAQVRRLGEEIENTRRALAAQQQALAAASEQGNRRERLAETAALGLAKLDDPDVAAANAWLRAHVRVWVNGRKVQAIEWV